MVKTEWSDNICYVECYVRSWDLCWRKQLPATAHQPYSTSGLQWICHLWLSRNSCCLSLSLSICLNLVLLVFLLHSATCLLNNTERTIPLRWVTSPNGEPTIVYRVSFFFVRAICHLRFLFLCKQVMEHMVLSISFLPQNVFFLD